MGLRAVLGSFCKQSITTCRIIFLYPVLFGESRLFRLGFKGRTIKRFRVKGLGLTVRVQSEGFQNDGLGFSLRTRVQGYSSP